MGKSYRDDRNHDRHDDYSNETVMVPLDQVHVPDRTWTKVMRDKGQIEKMRVDFESGRMMVRVVLRPRCGGGYNIEDGRHRVIAAKLAGVGFIEAMIVGS